MFSSVAVIKRYADHLWNPSTKKKVRHQPVESGESSKAIGNRRGVGRGERVGEEEGRRGENVGREGGGEGENVGGEEGGGEGGGEEEGGGRRGEMDENEKQESLKEISREIPEKVLFFFSYDTTITNYFIYAAKRIEDA